MNPMVKYLVSAWIGWQKANNYIVPETDMPFYESVATDIVFVAETPRETPLFKGEDGRKKTAVLMGSIFFWESRLVQRIDAGNCLKHECDGGKAFTGFQIHPGPTGIVLDFTNGKYAYARVGEEGITGKAMVADRQLAATVSLHMTRESIQQTGTLCIYTGEPCKGEMPKAKLRFNNAKLWVESHPLPKEPPDDASKG